MICRAEFSDGYKVLWHIALIFLKPVAALNMSENLARYLSPANDFKAKEHNFGEIQEIGGGILQAKQEINQVAKPILVKAAIG